MAHHSVPVMLANMCALTDGKGNVLVLDRCKIDWRGIAFPGGHVEPGESFVDSMIREMHEETGLTIERPRLVGIKDWDTEDGGRYVVLLYRADSYTGTLTSSDEGPVFWTPIDTLNELALAPDISEDIRILLTGEYTEHRFIQNEQKEWIDILK